MQKTDDDVDESADADRTCRSKSNNLNAHYLKKLKKLQAEHNGKQIAHNCSGNGNGNGNGTQTNIALILTAQ